MFCYSLHHQYWKSIIFQQNLVMVTLTNLDSFTAMNVLSSAGVDAIMVSAHFRSTKFQDWAFLYNLVVVYPSKMKLFSFQIDKIFKKQVFLQLICLLILWIRIILWKLRWKKYQIFQFPNYILKRIISFLSKSVFQMTCIYFVL